VAGALPREEATRWLLQHPDERQRCWWCGHDPLYVAYHDREWGRPVHDDTRLFEKICLEGFQAGLSWLTILRKREQFRQAFAGFEIARVAGFGSTDIERLLTDAGIVRHRGKIASAINNAQRYAELVNEFGSLDAFVWGFVTSDREGDRATPPGIPTHTPASTRLSKELKQRGWTFVGPTTMYAFMQSVGVVNDHLNGCWAYQDVQA
jgi:DNA-3-methyladenine glycosylase I